MKVRVLYHDHCFDGAASAAFVTRFLESKFYPGGGIRTTPALRTVPISCLKTVCSMAMRTRSSTSNTRRIPNLTWWFDHHQSAFLSPEDAEHFRHDTSGQKLFDPSYRSCTKFISPWRRTVRLRSARSWKSW